MGFLSKFRKNSRQQTLEQEVVDHLSSLLNTKAMFGAWQKGLGMNSYSCGKERPQIIEDMIEDLKFNIETYEKRIKIVAIEVVESKYRIIPRFQLECLLGERLHAFYIGFNHAQNSIDVEVV